MQQIVKHSAIYGYLISQPFATYVEANPLIEGKILQQAEELKSGYHGEAVRILQKKLKTLTYYTDDPDGNFDLQTEHAVKNFQAEHDMSITGVVDNGTTSRLLEIESEFFLNQLIYLTPLVYPGMVSTTVKRAQESLKYFEYYEGEIDGIYGPLTKNAFEIAAIEHNLDLSEQTLEPIQEEIVTTVEEVSAPQEVIVTEQERVNDPPAQQENNTSQEAATTQKEEKEEVKTHVEETPKEVKKATIISTNHSSIVQNARSLMGTPYVWGGTSTSGFDCSGFIQYVFKQNNLLIPRTVSDIWNFSNGVSSPSIGDLVFFETYQPGPSHMGIYLGEGNFIHAGSSRGVEISNLNNNSYWKSRYLGAKRIH